MISRPTLPDRGAHVTVDPAFEKCLMNIFETGIRAAREKLVTCAHVVEALGKDTKPKPPT